MRLRGTLLLATAAGVAAVLTLAGPAAALPPPNVACGQTLHASVTLTANLDCSGYAGSVLIVDSPNVTINLNGHWIKGDSSETVIDNSTTPYGYNLIVENGTLFVGDNGTGVDNSYSGPAEPPANVTVNNVTMGPADAAGVGTGYGVYADEGDRGLTVMNSTISDLEYGVYLDGNFNTMIKGVTFSIPTGGYGVYSEYTTGMSIMGSTFTGPGTGAQGSAVGQSGYGWYTDAYDAGTIFSGNKLSGLEYGIEYSSGYDAGLQITGNVFGAGGNGNDYGIELYSDNGDVISNNYILNSTNEGIYDYESNNAVYTGNILTSNGGYAFDIEPYTYGPVTMVNNYARSSGEYGFYLYEPYNDAGNIPTPPYTLFSGNSATSNGYTGFYLEYMDGATITHNTAYSNGGDGSSYDDQNGFYIDYADQAAINNNTATLNAMEGFLFENSYEGTAPSSFANNTATYNGDFGFMSYDYPVAGSGNTGGDTNGASSGVGDCYLVAGCS